MRLCGSPKLDGTIVLMSVALSPQSCHLTFWIRRFITQVNQHRMMLIIEPAAEDFKTPVAQQRKLPV